MYRGWNGEERSKGDHSEMVHQEHERKGVGAKKKKKKNCTMHVMEPPTFT